MNLDQRAVSFPNDGILSGRLGLLAPYLVLGALALSPLLRVKIPPLIDYPNHLARMSILAHAEAGTASLSYIAHWRLLPNLAMDLIVPPLTRFMPLEDAGRLFIALTIALLVLGAVSLNRVLWGRFTLWPTSSLLFVYNKVLWWGFLNYLFGLGVALLCFSAWIASEHWKPARRLAVFAVLASLLCILHLFALGVYGLLVLSYEAGAWLTGNGRLKGNSAASPAMLAHFVPAMLLWLISAPGGGPKYTAFGDIRTPLDAFLAPVSFGMPPSTFDLALAALCLASLLLLLRGGILHCAPAMRLPIAAMVVVSLLMPEWISGSWGAHIRLPVALSFVLIGSLRLDKMQPMRIAGIALLALLFLGTRVWAVSQNWQDMERRDAELRVAFRDLPAGARLLTAVGAMPATARAVPGVPTAFQTETDLAYWHMPAMAVIDRDAFVPGLFIGWTPVEPSPRNAGLSRIMSGLLTPKDLIERASPQSASSLRDRRDLLGEPPCCLDWPATYDFVLWIDFGQAPHPLPEPLADKLQPWASGSFFHIFRVAGPSASDEHRSGPPLPQSQLSPNASSPSSR